MAEMILTAGRDFLSQASSSVFAGLGDNAGDLGNPNLTGTEAYTATTVRAAGTATAIYTTLTSNSRTTTTVLTLRKNSTDTDLIISIGSGVTGNLSDTGSADFADGDTLGVEFATGTGTQSITCQNISVVYDTDSGSARQVCTTRDIGFGGTGSLTRYASPLGETFLTSTEVNEHCVAPVATTLSNLQVYVRDNGRSTASVFTVRNNGSDGNQSVSFGSGVTGLLEDTSNTDSVSAGNTFNLKFERGTGTGNFTIVRMGVMQTTDGSGFPISSAGSGGFTTSSTAYSQFWGDCDNFSSESDTDHLVPIALDLNNLSVNVASNSSTSTTTWQLRINGVDGNQSVAYGSGVTGVLQDTSNTDSISANDLVNYKCSGQNANIKVSGTSIFATPAGGGGSEAVASATGTSTSVSVGSSQFKAVASSTGTSEAVAAGQATISAVGATSGTSSALGVGESVFSGVATSEGDSTTAATGSSEFAALASSTGTSTSTATGASKFAAIASSTGESSAAATGDSTTAGTEAVASSVGTSEALAVGASAFKAVAVTSGTSTVTGVSFVSGSVANAAGSSTTLGVGGADFHAVAASNGTSTTSAIGVSKFLGVASSSGSSTSSGVGTAAIKSVGASTGASAVSGIGSSKFAATAAAVGLSTVAAVGRSKFKSLASSTGLSTVIGISDSTGIITLDTLDLQLQITLLNNSLNISIVKELELIVSTK